MLLEFSCSNHKSIRKPILFSTLATKDSTHQEFLISLQSNETTIKILKSAVIYGANGSGKSNFIHAISFVKNLITDSIKHQPGDGILQLPHKLNNATSNSTYTLQFIISNIRYAYGFTLKNYEIIEEYLYYFPHGRQTKIFERNGIKFEEGSKFKGKLDTCKTVLKNNRLLLSCAANFSSINEIEKVYRFFKNDIVIYAPNDSRNIDMNWLHYSLYKINASSTLKKQVIHLMNTLGVNIKDIDIKIEKQSIPQNAFPNFLSDEFKQKIMQQQADAISAKIIYDQFSVDLIHEESTGIQKLFAMMCPLIDIMIAGKVLICDELETSLHEALIHAIISLFLSSNMNQKAQLIFTTHDTSLLDLDIFRRDQIWFTELNPQDRSTELYSLAELKNVRKDEKFSKGYISGKYGGIPMLNDTFSDIVTHSKSENEVQ